MKSTTTKMKNSLEGFKINFEQAEVRSSKLKDRTMKIIVAGEQKEKRFKKSKQSLKDVWDTTKLTRICIAGVPGEEGEKGSENI